MQWKKSLSTYLEANYKASFKWAVLCAYVGTRYVCACVCGAGLGPVQAVPVCDSWGGTQTHREGGEQAHFTRGRQILV